MSRSRIPVNCCGSCLCWALAVLAAVLALGLLPPQAAAEPPAPQAPQFTTINPLLDKRAGPTLFSSNISELKFLWR
jgi:hypothetical protein